MIIIESFNNEGQVVANENACDERHGMKIAKERLSAGLGLNIAGNDVFSLGAAFYAIQRAFAVEVAA